MRLFIAVDIPDEVKSYFADVQKQIPDFKGKLVSKEHMHLTLKFLGEFADNKLDLIKETLINIKFEKISFFTTSIGFFPSENYIRVIWVGLEPKDEIVELQKKIDNGLKELFPKDKKFHPHLTLARVKFIHDKDEFIQDIKKIKLEKKEFTINSFKLIKSTLTEKGPVYEEIKKFKGKL